LIDRVVEMAKTDIRLRKMVNYKITLWCSGEIKQDTLRRDAMAHHQATTNSSIHFVLYHSLRLNLTIDWLTNFRENRH